MGIYGDNLSTVVAQQLQAERAIKGWSYRALAEAAGLKEQSVMRYLTGKRDIPMTEVGLMADALGLTPADLLRRAIDRIPQ